MSDDIYVCERTEVSAQIRGRLIAPLGEVGSVADTVLQLDRGRASLRDLNQRLARLTQDDTARERGNDLRERRGRLIAEQDATQRRLKEVEAEIVQLEAKLVELRGQETEQRKVVEKIDRGRTLSLTAHRYREAVAKIKSAAAIQLREQISQIVGELWVDITERGLEFNGLEFDAQWNCQLRRRSGSLVPWELVNTSAGQKQVRLLAFTEALRRLARLAPPLVVDTPLGRFDKEVRRSVLERLYLSGHQAIVLTTNAEIDPDSEQFDRIKNSLARVYTLHPDGNPESGDYAVRVTDDYFGRSL